VSDDAPPQLNPALDWDALAATFARDRRVRIHDFLTPESAAALTRHLRARQDWLLVLNAQDRLFELSRAARASLPPDRAAALATAVKAQAQFGFQFHYESIRVPDAAAARAADPTLLNQLAQLMSSPEVIARLRQVTGADDIAFADAQATAYAPGDFLTAHDDDVEGKGRRAAFVLGLTPEWRIDWGGLLLVHDDGVAWVPKFNTLNLFAIPQPHSVSQVSTFAADRRYAVTGWLRAGVVP
jgi:Rps23 Pro-64 3,4-dihydroxylase Tpa1-like proline 4-hydroxylase